MKSNHKKGNGLARRLVLGAVVLALGMAAFWLAGERAGATPPVDPAARMYRQPAPDLDLNASRALANTRQATSAQLAAAQALRTSANAPNMQVRWNNFGGSVDAVYDFASRPYAGTPEEAGRAFLSENGAMFGIADVNTLRVFSEREAGGGYLIRFQQTFNGIAVENGGVGLVMNANKQVIMASGPYFRNVTVNTVPTLSASQAVTRANADLNQFAVNLPAAANNILGPANNLIASQVSAVNNVPPTLGIYPTADGYKLVWKVGKFSTNPFGLYVVSIDAHTGQTVARKDFVSHQAPPGGETADIYPKYPQIDSSLKDNSIISTCAGPLGPRPCGQERVTLRGFDPTNRASGQNGTLTGAHALVNNALATKQPFAQAALGTWHFRQDVAPLEARTNEVDQFAEPAEHQDEINAFFFVTYLLEYVDHLHVGGDNNQFGGGAFPDDYPNQTLPLAATVHIPNIYLAIDASNGELPDPTHPDFVQIALGLDNAVALNVTSLIELITATKSPVVVNPTVYGHGYLFNDLALEGTVPYHEGMHSITSPIAGLEGSEGSALNEGQADMWAFTITDNPSLGDYVVNAKGFRQYFRDNGRDPDTIAYIRSGESTLKYSDIGTWSAAGAFEEHYDGEIYMSTMWDFREMLNRVYPQEDNRRPQASDGTPNKVITRGTNIFERDFLMSMYVLGTTSPDTMVKARDALIVADQMLYPLDTSDPDSPGKHRAMIEQIFAAKELGINAREVDGGGHATISTQVTTFAGTQPAPSVPQNVGVDSSGTKALRISWEPVTGAVSYEVLKRKIGLEGQRQPNGKRTFLDGDASTTGFRHVAFVDGDETSYTDNGPVHEVYAPEGIKNLFDSEYVVRAIGVNQSGQLGWSALSGSARVFRADQDLTQQIDSAISNITFSNGVMAFDNRLTNTRGAFSFDRAAYAPLKFEITSISNPTVTVRNPDEGNNTFVYNQTLPLGATSAAKRMQFNDPMAQLFTFDARITAGALFSSELGNGSQPPDGWVEPPAPVTYSIFRETRTGSLLGGEPSSFVTEEPSSTYGDPAFRGLTWDEVAVTTLSDAQLIDATLTATGAAVDIDFELRTADGTLVASSTSSTATEHFTVPVEPNTQYFFRVLGWANGPTTYNIVSDQLLPEGSPNANAGTTQIGGGGPFGGGGGGGGIIHRLVRFTVNPVLRTVTFRLL